MKKYQLIAGLFAFLVAGCSYLPSFESKTDYKSAEKTKDLEVPPDLTAPVSGERYAVPESGEATYSSYSKEKAAPTQQVLPAVKTARMERAGSERWLVVQGTPEVLWPQVKDFMVKSGFVLKVDNPQIGLMETGWAEKNTEVEETGIRAFLSKAINSLYSTSLRDKYRVRLERGRTPGTTEIFVSHQGMEEVLQGKGGGPTGQTIWQPRASDPSLEAEMLSRLMVSLGASADEAKTVSADAGVRQARIAGGALLLDDPFDRAWRRVGIALDRAGFTVEDQDREKGVFFVRYVEPETQSDEGLLSSLAFWKSKPKAMPEQHTIQVKGVSGGSRVQVLDSDRSDSSVKILNLLLEQLK